MKLNKSILNKNIIIAVDIALNKTGVAIMGYNREVYSTFLIKSKATDPYYTKLEKLYDTFFDIFSIIVKNNPQSVVLILEDRLKAGFSGSTLASIEGARVTSYHAFNHSFKDCKIIKSVLLYDPGLIKKHFTGKSAVKKEVVLKSAIEKNPILKRYKQEDILDAMYLVLYHLDVLKVQKR